MKKGSIGATLCHESVLAAAVMISLVGLQPGSPAAAQQSGQGKLLMEVSARLALLIGKANQAGYEIQDNKAAVGGAYLTPGLTPGEKDKAWTPVLTVSLDAGKKYRFLAAGDDNAKDVDLEIHDPKGKLLAADVGKEADAIVDFTPKVAGKYTVRVRLFESKQNVSCFCLAVVMREK